jgi:hypothetical protein
MEVLEPYFCLTVMFGIYEPTSSDNRKLSGESATGEFKSFTRRFS